MLILLAPTFRADSNKLDPALTRVLWTQGETVSLADKYGLIAGGAAAGATLLKKQVQYRQSHGIGKFDLESAKDLNE